MLHTVILALVQSATEFLPVSSSAHLILVPRLMNWADQGLATDVALHVGTLFAVMLYFRKDVFAMLRGAADILKRSFSTFEARLVFNLCVATVPALLFGFFFHDYIEQALRSEKVIASTAIVFGIILYVADKKGKTAGSVETMGIKEAFVIGLAQMLALIPGVSRSGITMTAARALGIGREEAARFSMLLAVPTIGAAGAWAALKIITAPVAQQIDASLIVTGMAVSFVGGALAISFLMNWLKKSSFAIFAAYRILLGSALFFVF